MKKILLTLTMATMTSVYAENPPTPKFEKKEQASADKPVTPPAPQPQQVVLSIPDMNAFWASCKEYILGPIVNNIVEKRVQEMSIGDLSKTLESKVNTVMAEFIKEGNAAKELSLKKGNVDEIKCHHIIMSELFHTVRPAEATVRGMYPKMVKLFDQLNKLYPDQYTQLDYVIDEKTFMETTKEVAVAFKDIPSTGEIKPIVVIDNSKLEEKPVVVEPKAEEKPEVKKEEKKPSRLWW